MSAIQNTMNNRLMDQYKFTHDDVKTNHRGQISERQQRQLSRKQSSGQTSLMASGFMLIAVFFAWTTLFKESAPFYIMLGGIGGFLMLIGGIVMLMLNDQETLENAAVLEVSGRVRLGKTKNDKGREVFVVKVGQETFTMPEKEAKAFRNGGIYRIYFLDGGTILSAYAARKQPQPRKKA
jgi:hypothetical protein